MAVSNLLVTFDPTHSESAKKEISERLSDIKEKGKILKIDEGMAEVSVKDANKTISVLEKLSKKKGKFEYTKKWIPVDKWTNAKIPDMQKTIKSIAKGISSKEKWKMDLSTHKANIQFRDVIIKLTEVVDNQNVDLDKPDKIIKVTIVGKKAGISLIGKNGLLNVSK